VSVDMRLEAASEETAGSEVSEPLADSLEGPLDCCGLAFQATTAVYAGPYLPASGLQEAAASPEVPNADDPSGGLGTGRLVAGPDEPSELESYSAFLFAAGLCSGLPDA
jgi:hypothetical protein